MSCLTEGLIDATVIVAILGVGLFWIDRRRQAAVVNFQAFRRQMDDAFAKLKKPESHDDAFREEALHRLQAKEAQPMRPDALSALHRASPDDDAELRALDMETSAHDAQRSAGSDVGC
jgi:hypothetical protein